MIASLRTSAAAADATVATWQNGCRTATISQVVKNHQKFVKLTKSFLSMHNYA
jgi:hypothetical protein